MKKVKRRATAALLLAFLLVFGLLLFTFQLVRDGGDWATFRANSSVYKDGILNTGTLTDRNGTVLAHAGDGIYYYAEDALTRTSCFHVVGDYAGNVGTGALTAFSDALTGYSLVNGTYSRTEATVELTIDSALNNTAYTALAGRSGAVLVMDYTTGEILCMVSSISYDPTSGADVTSDAYDGVFINRAISSTYTPGSVFKLVTLAAAIENISDLSSRSFYCSGSTTVGGDTVVCSGVHGTQTIEQALANSCNCAFAELSLELGSDLICKYADDFGFTSTHDLNGITTAAGTVEAASAGSSDLAWSGIGQYTDLISPFAMLRYVAAIANGGTCVEPTLLLGESCGETALLASSTANRIADMMANNVTSSYGSWSFPGLDIAAKSGTAETGRGTSHAWFAGFLRDSDNPYAFVVIVEDGGGGLSAAGPVANAVLQEAVK